MDRAARWWLALGWVGFAVLPWYFADGGTGAASYPRGPYGAALALGVAGDP